MDAFSKVTLHTGNKMPVLGLGTWQLANDTPGSIAHALRIGYRMIDTSGDYGTQPGIAQGLKTSGIKRESLYIVTKIEEYENAYESTQKNLRELELDYADLMLIHRPPARGAGEELWRGLRRAKQDGLTRDIGVSNYSHDLIDRLADATGEMPAVNQIEWSPFGFSLDMLEYARNHSIVIQAYSPLTRTVRLNDPTLEYLALSYHKTPAQILLRWNLQLGTVPIPKANQQIHQEENLDVFDFIISESDMAALGSLNERYSSLGHLPYD